MPPSSEYWGLPSITRLTASLRERVAQATQLNRHTAMRTSHQPDRRKRLHPCGVSEGLQPCKPCLEVALGLMRFRPSKSLSEVCIFSHHQKWLCDQALKMPSPHAGRCSRHPSREIAQRAPNISALKTSFFRLWIQDPSDFPRLWKARKQGACPCKNRRPHLIQTYDRRQ